MKNCLSQAIKDGFSNARLLLLFLLLTLVSISQSAEMVPAEVTATATEAAPFGDIGQPNDGRVKEKPRLENLGKEIYRIGAIKIDKSRRLITVPGVMLPYEEGKAIEFMASMKQGYKSYESVISLEANAFEFNLACILIGLDNGKKVAPEYHFDDRPVQGHPVSIRVGWQHKGKMLEHDVADLLKVGKTKPKTPSEWSYTGSMFIDGDKYLAQMDGVLIGLIHDPSSIIEHKQGLGIGNWGSLTVDAEIAPPGGQEIILQIQGID